jgi:hypothetical protein
MAAPNEEPPIAAGVQGTTKTTSASDSATAAAERKADATLAAIAAMNGFQARKLDGGAWLISRWNLCKELPDRSAAAEFLRRAGVAV